MGPAPAGVPSRTPAVPHLRRGTGRAGEALPAHPGTTGRGRGQVPRRARSSPRDLRVLLLHDMTVKRSCRLVDRAGSAVCGLCGEGFPAELVDVDHRTPLALGGEDTDSNVWPLCRECHRGKTARDFGLFVVGP
ncbi:HNH endonuclease signature motif containing protein [Kitasatospora purpeofusca]|uniref:HNH endonuclease signature motif containing protein n=1 Tax=Kitasatospora purpeofusca TaxID=67352 RepID=UPI0035D5BEB3